MDASTAPSTLEYGKILIGLFGGLAIFLYGMKKLSEGLKTAAGSGMKRILKKLTQNRFTSLTAGAVITAIIQSSSVTTVLMVGFISAGLLTSAQSVGVIIGANIGTTFTTQIIAFKISQYSLFMLVAGVFLEMMVKNERLKQAAVLLVSLGFIFFGMQVMSEATRPLRDYAPFIDLMRNLQNPLMGVIISAVFTAAIHSSTATTGIVIVLAEQGFISLEAGITLVLGSNIGTCITAMLASIGKPREAVKAAFIHVIFNVVGVLIWLPFIDQFASVIRFISPVAENASGMARLALETPRQIANAHSFFNVANAVLFIGFTTPLAALVNVLIPSRPEKKKPLVEPQYLDPIFISQPELALESVRLELSRLGQFVLNMVQHAYSAIKTDQLESIKKLKSMDDEADKLYAAIVEYLRSLSAAELTEKQSRISYHYLAMSNIFESIGDIIENNLVYEAEARLKSGLKVSPGTLDYLESLHKELCATGQLSVHSIQNYDPAIASRENAAKNNFDKLLKEARKHLAVRLCQKEPNRLEAYRLETDIMESFNYLHTLFRKIAKLIQTIRNMDKDGGEYLTADQKAP